MASGAGVAGAGISLVGLGLGLGLNPALYGATVDMLARTENPVRRLIWMLGGLFVGATALFFVLQGLNPNHFIGVLKQDLKADVLNRIVDAIAGGLFFLGGIAVIVWKVRVPVAHKRAAKAPKEHSGLWSYFVLGLGSSVIGFTTLPIMYLTGRVVMGATHNLELRIALFALFLLALASPFVLLAVVWSRFPKFSHAFQDVYTKALGRDYRYLIGGLSVAVGAGFIIFAMVPHAAS